MEGVARASYGWESKQEPKTLRCSSEAQGCQQDCRFCDASEDADQNAEEKVQPEAAEQRFAMKGGALVSTDAWGKALSETEMKRTANPTP